MICAAHWGSNAPATGCGLDRAPTPPRETSMSSIDQAPRQPWRVALLVAGAMFMEQLDGTVIATALPQMANSFGVAAVDLNIGMSAYLLTLGGLHSGERLDRGQVRRPHRVHQRHCDLHAGLDPVRIERELVAVHRRAGAAGHRWRPDGADRPADRAAQHREAAPDAGHRLSDLAGIVGPDPGAAARRPHHLLCVVALDLSPEHPARPDRHRGGAGAGPQRARRRPRAVRLARLRA